MRVNFRNGHPAFSLLTWFRLVILPGIIVYVGLTWNQTDALAAGGTITNGNNYTGTLLRGQIDQWTFSAKEGDAVWLTVTEVGQVGKDTNFIPQLQVYAPSRKNMGVSYGALWARVAFTAPEDGTYTVEVTRGGVTDSRNDGSGQYTLTLTQSPEPFSVPDGDEGGKLTNGGNFSGSLLRGDVDQWSFSATEGQTIWATVSEVSDVGKDQNFIPQLEVFSPSGKSMGYSYGALWARVAFTAPEDGTYEVDVLRGGVTDERNDGAAQYVLNLAQAGGEFIVPSGDDGGLLNNNSPASGSLLRGDVDLWTFAASEGDPVTVSISEVGDTGKDTNFIPQLEVLGPKGKSMGYSYGALFAKVSFTAPADGAYTVFVLRGGVTDSRNDGVAHYSLTLAHNTSQVAAPVAAAPLAPTPTPGPALTIAPPQVSGQPAPAPQPQVSVPAPAPVSAPVPAPAVVAPPDGQPQTVAPPDVPLAPAPPQTDAPAPPQTQSPATPVPARVAQGADGVLYLVRVVTIYVIVPVPISDDDLAAITLGSDVQGALNLPQPGAAQVVQGTDGSLYLVQGQAAFRLTPDSIGDDQVAALGVSGELDGSIPTELLAPTPAAATASAPPAQPGGDTVSPDPQPAPAPAAPAAPADAAAPAAPAAPADAAAPAAAAALPAAAPDAAPPAAASDAAPPAVAAPAPFALPAALTDDQRASILAAVDRANAAWVTAKATLDTSVLSPAVAGQELNNDMSEVNQLRSQGHTQRSVNTAFNVLDVSLNSPGHAVVHTTETWAADIQLAATGQLIQHLPASTYTETYTVDFLNGAWIVTLNDLN